MSDFSLNTSTNNSHGRVSALIGTPPFKWIFIFRLIRLIKNYSCQVLSPNVPDLALVLWSELSLLSSIPASLVRLTASCCYCHYRRMPWREDQYHRHESYKFKYGFSIYSRHMFAKKNRFIDFSVLKKPTSVWLSVFQKSRFRVGFRLTGLIQLTGCWVRFYAVKCLIADLGWYTSSKPCMYDVTQYPDDYAETGNSI